MCFKTYILKRLVNNKQLEINRSFDLDNHLAIVGFSHTCLVYQQKLFVLW
ncbi:hypothetical protein V438_08575 [Clostridioides difficile]|uniref:Uncharacterized protein n=1 Tax=Clostridioides difficile NAP08 TaxID=525259 RepID=D5Q3Z3_CLODI|nr:hypothetical protein HMPREF0220_1625 [Clostridioides difficile NAP08]EGT2201643.1 hypothetical protein [Clostridioides difficile]CCK92498.1 conserved hypothetical protein [Clostridioides difficile T20]CCK94345.1 conserved hypothetical protein [Clostridioides difficile E1]EGT2239843.1 hypothetical protein [Clostridioides difficile]